MMMMAKATDDEKTGQNNKKTHSHRSAHAHRDARNARHRPSPSSRPAGGVNEHMATRARILALRVATKDQW